MKKISGIIIALLLTLGVVRPAFAAFGGLKNELKDLKKEIKDEFQEDKFSSPEGTRNFVLPTPSATRRQTVQEKLENRIRERFPALLPYSLRKAEILSISQTTLPSEIVVKEKNKTITLRISKETLILKKTEGQASLSEFRIGDFVAAHGIWEDQEQTVLATKVLRNLSAEKKRVTFWGAIKSIDLSSQSFVVWTIKGEREIIIGEGTKIVGRDERQINFSDLKKRHWVRVSGELKVDTKETIRAVLIKDWSIKTL